MRTSLTILEQIDSRKVAAKGENAFQICRGGSRALPDDNQKHSALSIPNNDVESRFRSPVVTADLVMEQIQDENYRDIVFDPDSFHEQFPSSQVNCTSSINELSNASSRIPSRTLSRVTGCGMISGDCSVGNNSMRTFVTLPPTNFHTSRWKLGMSIVGIVFAGVAAGVIALILTMDDSSPVIVPELTTNEVATASPEVTDTMYLQLLQTQLREHDASFLRPNSPQSHALLWMAEIDSVRLNLSATNLQQRYALMVLWYTQGGSDWEDQGWAIPGVHECEWMHINCNEYKEVVGIVKGDGMKMTGSLATEIGILCKLGESNQETGWAFNAIGFLTSILLLIDSCAKR